MFITLSFLLLRDSLIIPLPININNQQKLIKTKSIYDVKEESGGIGILITRYYPRGIKRDQFDKWYRDLSSSNDLLKCFKDLKIN